MKKIIALLLTFTCAVLTLTSCSLFKNTSDEIWVLTTQTVYDSNGERLSKTEYGYDSLGRLNYKVFNENDDIRPSKDFEYDDDGNVISYTEKYSTSSDNYYVLEYDKSGNCISKECKCINFDEMLFEYNEYFEYDKNNNITHKNTFEYYSNDDYESFEYDYELTKEKGLAVNAKVTVAGKVVDGPEKTSENHVYFEEYKYDEYGNLIKKQEYHEADIITNVVIDERYCYLYKETYYEWEKLSDVSTPDNYLENGITEENYFVETTETTTESARLSDFCDMVLASGTNSNGDFYELVANESKSYDGKSEIGVIKNNEWLQGLTSESPFIDEYGVILNHYYDNQFIFCCESCFAYGYSGDYEILWNAETGAVFEGPGDLRFNIQKVNSEGGIRDFKITDFTKVFYHYDGTKLLNTKTMETTVVESEAFDYPAQLSEGLFYSRNYDDTVRGFYDENYNLVIDLSNYNITTKYYNMYFDDGVCSFWARNSSGTSFLITIDKDGNVLSELREDEV